MLNINRAIRTGSGLEAALPFPAAIAAANAYPKHAWGRDVVKQYNPDEFTMTRYLRGASPMDLKPESERSIVLVDFLEIALEPAVARVDISAGYVFGFKADHLSLGLGRESQALVTIQVAEYTHD